MEGKITVEEGLAAGIVLTVEEGETVTRALDIMTRHAEAIRDTGRPGAEEASQIIAHNILPLAQTFLMMLQTGMVLQREDSTKEIMDLLTPDPWGQAAQKE